MAKHALFPLFAVFLIIFGCAAKFDSTSCGNLDGRVINTMNENCTPGERNAGEVDGLHCPCICCVPLGPQQHQINSTECDSRGGRIVNTLGDSCLNNETDAGVVKGALCPCICCVPKTAPKGTLSSSECAGLGGRIESQTVETPIGGFKNKGCLQNETDMGALDDLLCPCVCCVPK